MKAISDAVKIILLGNRIYYVKLLEKYKRGKALNWMRYLTMKKLPLNREQRRKMPKNMDNPKELKDVVKSYMNFCAKMLLGVRRKKQVTAPPRRKRCHL